ncbi:peptidase inhibitor family I36 protein [Streptomyces sp. 110]|uniref:Peptidase inhibitor family I36 protein n=1 Tax=Streptomyces endocoffeicus TaxID=2898945 RepID=A0ABS1PMQ0_9ACTN|nr:peptidase inhibitor family I36 protein [Streptomyces endocoffeicus]MBL1113006.1 peptidase inhibitor family I36 protein [Streptomyces endocoffeicus]
MRMRVLLAAAGLMASLATVGGAVGQAEAAPSDCASKYLCAYPQTNYRGGAGPVKDDNSDLRQYSKFRHVQSIFNNGERCTAYLWSQPGYSGVMHTLSRGDGYPNLDHIPEYRTTGIQSNHWCNPG